MGPLAHIPVWRCCKPVDRPQQIHATDDPNYLSLEVYDGQSLQLAFEHELGRLSDAEIGPDARIKSP